jgi:hypothetical protein
VVIEMRGGSLQVELCGTSDQAQVSEEFLVRSSII